MVGRVCVCVFVYVYAGVQSSVYGVYPYLPVCVNLGVCMCAGVCHCICLINSARVRVCVCLCVHCIVSVCAYGYQRMNAYVYVRLCRSVYVSLRSGLYVVASSTHINRHARAEFIEIHTLTDVLRHTFIHTHPHAVRYRWT